MVTSLDIVNISTPKLLTRIFTNASYSLLTDIEPAEMTYYISPNDETKTKYLYYTMTYEVNGTQYVSAIKSDIFNTDFSQNNAINDLPLLVQEATANKAYGPPYIWELSTMETCTNPVTNDILTCWFAQEPGSVAAIETCNIFFVKTNTFSAPILVNNATMRRGNGDGALNVICFNDSYLVPHELIPEHPEREGVQLYALLIDLNGNVVHNQLMQNISNADSLLLSSKSGDNFDAKQINNQASSLVAFGYESFDATTNTTTMVNFYGYYTSINDDNFPIYIYNESIHLNKTWKRYGFNFYISYLSDTLDFTDDCCYIELYEDFEVIDDDHDQIENLNVLITDIYGNQIDIKQYPNYTEIPLVKNITINNYPDPLFVDLKNISDATTHYFAIFYYKGIGIYDIANVTIADIYYLQQDAENPTQYDLMAAGTFETAKLVQTPDCNDEDVFGFDVYNMPETNDIYISWSQYHSCHVNNTFFNYQDLYGQTFQVR